MASPRTPPGAVAVGPQTQSIRRRPAARWAIVGPRGDPHITRAGWYPPRAGAGAGGPPPRVACRVAAPASDRGGDRARGRAPRH